jgi:hypothetical protein
LAALALAIGAATITTAATASVPAVVRPIRMKPS